MGGAAWGQVEPIQSELKQEYQTILCETENWREDTKMAGRYKNGGKMNRTKNNAKHDKIIQYFPQFSARNVLNRRKTNNRNS
jgi:hypothetical protein